MAIDARPQQASSARELERIKTYVRELKRQETEPICAYIRDVGALVDHVRQRVQSMPSASRLFYAMKANSEEEVLRALAPVAHGFEVASLGEVVKARRVSADLPIIFGGPGKTESELRGALDQQVMLIHVESLHELRKLQAIAAERGTVASVLLRVNLKGPLPEATLAMGGRPTQFGIDEALLPQVMEQIAGMPHIRVEGFHFHSLSNNLDAAQHVKLVQYYCRIAREWAQRYRFPLRYLNAGGGIGVNYADLEQQFDWPHFVDGLAAVLRRELLPETTLLFECGRYMTASSGYYATEVLDVKVNHGRTYAIVRGGTHHFRLPVSWGHSHPFAVVRIEEWPYPYDRPGVQGEPYTVAGQLCTPKDVLASGSAADEVRVGDVLVFRYAGAYGWAISHHDFLSHPHPRHVYLYE
ncbi:diaminopimelate decarboxylase [Paenibacillus sp. 598K]|uniref:type III PLP-dependent enzyme n=1 Tax=Paenibacillus sp. 598K TaxID=1117987 RepID=UPI000FFAC14A|nr:type III PLP-dependent enzyme [Paenibacillus sp. 598K]GBF76057.1 diaminopimelate decarboxylase [Paenibacillus sp. 598K]